MTKRNVKGSRQIIAGRMAAYRVARRPTTAALAVWARNMLNRHLPLDGPRGIIAQAQDRNGAPCISKAPFVTIHVRP
jgi:hypothetical protein